MADRKSMWDLIREYADGQRGSFTSQEVISWMRRHAPDQANERTIRTQVRGASFNVGDRSQFAGREPFLKRIDRGVFRKATADEIAAWRVNNPSGPARVQIAPVGDAASEWHTEAKTQQLLVEHLKAKGWSITRAADTEAREHGIDVVAERDGQVVAVEVKGYPSRWHVRGPLRGQLKSSRPADQAPKWFAHALVPAMRVRDAQPEWRSAICFPDFPEYRKLHAGTAVSLEACGIEMWLLSEDGSLEVLSR